MTRQRALVLGGSGTVGSEVVRGLVAAGLATVFTYRESESKAFALSGDTGAVARRVELRDARAIGGLDDGEGFDVLVHCAATLSDDADACYEVNARSALLACRTLAPAMTRRGGGHVVLTGALAPGQSLPLPAPFAASQAMLGGLAMALGKELGPSGIRVNLVALGLLDSGLSRGIAPKHFEDYLRHSALRRLGTAAEAAKPILWLALRNTYMSGKVLAANGGIG
ncbi:MAG: SDR family oxidoreductase [Acidobacteriota bacterium]